MPRTVTVYPASDQASVEQILDGLSTQRLPWYIDGCLLVYRSVDTEDLPLFYGLDPDEIEAVERVVGHRPRWTMSIDVSYRVDGRAELRRLVLTLLREGGAAVDDYSLHPWSREQIEADRTVAGRRFFEPATTRP
jgi:hypothetical protein